jgi:NAD-dependent dihydropyrimidine dehydrogenase PreA subunit
MTMRVIRELCKGCGDCVAACPNQAIRLSDGKAFIDQEICSSCQICAEVCPTGALQLTTVSPVVTEKTSTMEVLQPQTAIGVTHKQPNWGVTILSAVGQQLLPRLVDVLAAYLERRLSGPVQERNSITINPVRNHLYQRRRQRHGRYL